MNHTVTFHFCTFVSTIVKLKTDSTFESTASLSVICGHFFRSKSILKLSTSALIKLSNVRKLRYSFQLQLSTLSLTIQKDSLLKRMTRKTTSTTLRTKASISQISLCSVVLINLSIST